MQGILDSLGQLVSPIGTIFHFVFYLPVFNILMVIYQAVNSFFPAGAFAIAIVLLTILIRCALIPLTRKQLRSTRKMQLLQPQLKELQARYRSEPQRLMREQQALYKENGVSMYGGCLPLLVQMPFLYALFFSFNTLLQVQQVKLANGTSVAENAIQHLARINHDLYPFVPHLLNLPSTQFLWTNLAHADPYHILPVLAGLLTFFQLRMAMPYRKQEPGAQPDVMTQSTRTTQYIMPFVTVFIGWAVPSGLALYWTISTGFSALQQYFISGWGSFWVGIPGMEHMVKEQTLPTATVKPASTSSSARALTPASTAPPSSGGIGGWFSRLRETATAMTEERMRDREETNQKPSNGASNGQSANGASTTTANSANRDRRERRGREGPVLVKATQPAPDAVDAAIAEATSQSDLPEAEIARAASGAPKASNGSSNGNGASNGKGAAKSNGNGNGTAALAASNGNARPVANGNGRANQQRKGSGKGSSGSRPRGGRPKGGR